MTAMVCDVLDELVRVEKERDVRVLLAVECGSRCWGLQDAGSDRDVRFVYARPRMDYVTLRRRKEVIDWAHTDDLEMSGFDVSKFLTLLRASNPTVLEWLGSPVTYLEDGAMECVRELADECLNPVALAWHYRNMASNHDVRYIRSGKVTPKRYLFAARGLLSCEWVVERLSMPPTSFNELVGEVMGPELAPVVLELADAKRSGHGRDRIPNIEALDEWIFGTEEALKGRISAIRPTKRPDGALFDVVFRELVGF